jgi:hypothetical protein
MGCRHYDYRNTLENAKPIKKPVGVELSTIAL